MPNQGEQNTNGLTPDFQLRSEEVQDILTRIPHWMIRWGSLVVWCILMLLFGFSWWLKYPDVVSTEIIITTPIPPEKLMARVTGKMQAILVQDKAIVQPHSALAVIENTANFNDVFLLKSITDTLRLENAIFPFEYSIEWQLGDVEPAFAQFHKEYLASQLNKAFQPFRVESKAQKLEQVELNERLGLLISQKELNKAELELQKKDLDRYETLFQKGVIAAQELEKQRLIYLQAEKNYRSILSSISQHKSALNELNKSIQNTQINESTTDSNLERGVYQAFFQLKKALKDWELQYVLRTANGGRVSYLQFWSEGQPISAGDEVFVVVPEHHNAYIGKAKSQALNSGKVTVGQKVQIRLLNYPDREFGIIEGKVKSMALTPDKEGNLLIDIELPKGLVTTYQKEIEFKQEMVGDAAIITEDIRLINRFLYQFKDIFRRDGIKSNTVNN